jgi:hypothetical protein
MDCAFNDCFKNVLDGRFYVHRIILDNVNAHIAGQLLLNLPAGLDHSICDIRRIGSRLFDNINADSRLPLVESQAVLVFYPIRYNRYVPEVNGLTVPSGDYQVLELL